MSADDRWLLPDGIDELLPAQANVLEGLRRRCLDLLKSWGYALVDPPIIEYLDTLVSGMGEDLDLQTFKLIDQLSGRMLGLRADMTSQVARIDAHRLRRDVPTRLCYAGLTLHTLPENFAGSRNPLQLGAELYGYAGIEADIEILEVMLGVLHAAGQGDIWVDLGHVGIYRELIKAANLDRADAVRLFEALQRKDTADVAVLVHTCGITEPLASMVTALTDLNGDTGVVDRATAMFAGGPPAVVAILGDLQEFVQLCHTRMPGCRLHIDLAEQSQYQYHTGFIFAAYARGHGNALAAGGRYDDVGLHFGRPRAATGFSTDLKRLAKLNLPGVASPAGILAPADADPDLEALIRSLRSSGEVVVRVLPGIAMDAKQGPGWRILKKCAGRWEIAGFED